MDINVNLKITLEGTPALINTLSAFTEALQDLRKASCSAVKVDVNPDEIDSAPAPAVPEACSGCRWPGTGGGTTSSGSPTASGACFSTGTGGCTDSSAQAVHACRNSGRLRSADGRWQNE